MGQKIHQQMDSGLASPKGVNSRWFAPKKLFGELLIEDQQDPEIRG